MRRDKRDDGHPGIEDVLDHGAHRIEAPARRVDEDDREPALLFLHAVDGAVQVLGAVGVDDPVDVDEEGVARGLGAHRRGLKRQPRGQQGKVQGEPYPPSQRPHAASIAAAPVWSVTMTWCCRHQYLADGTSS